ncbi:MAG: hypothetical protein RMJ43_07665 [Chloroherpetonaceae bacterium]|nr:hypothetical protein [Chthonomonadaceae bacterium]MDW8207699.1 hypothetical protein [Chloroherpetonaceae bacterium]
MLRAVPPSFPDRPTAAVSRALTRVVRLCGPCLRSIGSGATFHRALVGKLSPASSPLWRQYAMYSSPSSPASIHLLLFGRDCHAHGRPT